MCWRRLAAAVSLGFENDAYQSAGSALVSGAKRRDNYFVVQPSLSYQFNDWVVATLSYEFGHNASTEPSLGFSDNRLTFRIGISF